MHLTGSQFMADYRQRLPETRDLGEAFAQLLRRAYGQTPKSVAIEVDLDPRAARNALEGKAGAPIITKSLLARQKAGDDHYELWLALGQMLFGETLDEYEERKLQRLIESTQNAKTIAEARAERRRALDRRASAAIDEWRSEDDRDERRAS